MGWLFYCRCYLTSIKVAMSHIQVGCCYGQLGPVVGDPPHIAGRLKPDDRGSVQPRPFHDDDDNDSMKK